MNVKKQLLTLDAVAPDARVFYNALEAKFKLNNARSSDTTRLRAIFDACIATPVDISEHCRFKLIYYTTNPVHSNLLVGTKSDEDALVITGIDFLHILSTIPPDIVFAIYSGHPLAEADLSAAPSGLYHPLTNPHSQYINSISHRNRAVATEHTFTHISTDSVPGTSKEEKAYCCVPSLDAFRRRVQALIQRTPSVYHLSFYAIAAMELDRSSDDFLINRQHYADDPTKLLTTIYMQLSVDLLRYIIRTITNDAWALVSTGMEYALAISVGVVNISDAAFKKKYMKHIYFSFTDLYPFTLKTGNTYHYECSLNKIETYILSNTDNVVISRNVIDYVMFTEATLVKIGVPFTPAVKRAILDSFSLRQLMVRTVAALIEMQADPPKGTMPGTMQAKKDRYATVLQTLRLELLKIV